MHSSTATEDFAKVVKVTNHNRQWDAELIWFSLSATHQICIIYDLEHGFIITWPCLMVKVLTTRAKFLEPSDYCNIINCIFTFRTTNVFHYLCSIATQFKLRKHKFLNYTIGMMVRVFANGPGDLGSIPGQVIPKILKMVLDASLLNTQHY